MASLAPARKSASEQIGVPRRIASLLVACAVGVSTAPGCTAHTLRVVIVDTRSSESVAQYEPEDLLADACDVWDFACETTLDQAGAVVITLVDGVGDIVGAPDNGLGLGGQATRSRCSPRVWSRDDDLTLAHELGHVLGLEHVSNERNVMTSHVRPSSTETTARQRKRVHRHAGMLAHCLGHRPILH